MPLYVSDKKCCSVLLNCSPSDCVALAESMRLYRKILNDVQILTSCSKTKAFTNVLYHRNKSCSSPFIYGMCAHVSSSGALS